MIHFELTQNIVLSLYTNNINNISHPKRYANLFNVCRKLEYLNETLNVKNIYHLFVTRIM